ncbi:hypothetical protein L209DRAFT_108265 [Thermothelomyces heterothallicus CBS 203.75]
MGPNLVSVAEAGTAIRNAGAEAAGAGDCNRKNILIPNKQKLNYGPEVTPAAVLGFGIFFDHCEGDLQRRDHSEVQQRDDQETGQGKGPVGEMRAPWLNPLWPLTPPISPQAPIGLFSASRKKHPCSVSWARRCPFSNSDSRPCPESAHNLKWPVVYGSAYMLRKHCATGRVKKEKGPVELTNKAHRLRDAKPSVNQQPRFHDLYDGSISPTTPPDMAHGRANNAYGPNK